MGNKDTDHIEFYTTIPVVHDLYAMPMHYSMCIVVLNAYS